MIGTRGHAADRGGPFGRDTVAALARAERDGAAPGTEFRFESGPAGSSPLRTPADSRRWMHPSALLAVAALFFGVATWHGASATYIHAKAWLGQRLLLGAWNAGNAPAEAIKPWPWADTHPIARLLVPAHDVDLLVLAGASGSTLAWGPGHVEGTAVPGARGTAVLTAHRDTHFAFLRDLRPGDRIVVQRKPGQTRNYRVDRTFVADHRMLSLPADDRSTTLALVTCYPFDAIAPASPLRYAVIARAD